MYAEILIQYGVKVLDKTFTYKIPNNMNISIGNKVKVLFANKIINGIVLNIKDNTELENVLEILEVVNPDIKLNKELLELGNYLSNITYTTLIKSYQTMLPTSLKVKNITSNYEKYDEYLVLNKSKDEILKYIENNKRAIAQIKILNDLLDNKKINKKEVSNSYKILIEKDLIKIIKERKYRLNKTDNEKKEYTLTKEQENVVNNVFLNSKDIYLLYGVTGSGKTIVYIDLIKKTIKNNKTALMLVPEISLTTQMVNRLYDSFGSDVAILHSGLSDGEKFDEYTKIYKNEVSVVVGTRSAIFAPLNNLGLIIIDEEHSTTYKQESSPRYNTIDIATWRGNYNNCPIILGSATPSLESFARAKKGVYKLLTLTNRVGNFRLPLVNIVDMSQEMKKRNMIFSNELKEKIKDTLERHEQVMLLLNRRGFSTIASCQNCGYTYKCPHCEISLIYHKSSNHLRCHYCGYTKLYNEICPECKEGAIRNFGTGTEKVSEEIKKLFPTARVLRMDADTTTKKGSHEKYINMISNGLVDIIIGTQMISKGLDFPNISLVGVINADESLNIPDFRSQEKTFSLLNQVSGRAGRSGIKSNVIIQTFNPDNKIFELVKNNDYIGLFNSEMIIRKKLNYPPYYYILGIKICSKDYELASKHATKIYNYLEKNIDDTSIILGPSTASMFKLNNIYRFQIIIKYKFDNKLENSIKFIDQLYSKEKDIYLEIDNNPISL
ncbi:MAG: primosomal protein N' [Bacilli bacterium]|nr:primosomal protein N' [Bacilli bacterium]